MMILKVLGALLIAVGVLDFGLSWSGTDLWGQIIGVQLPELLWKYSAYIEGIVGFGLWSLGGRGDDGAEAAK